MSQTSSAFRMTPMWPGAPEQAKPDTHARFTGEFTLATDGEVEIRLHSPGPSLVWLDGEIVLDGPMRYAPGFPDYAWHIAKLAKGVHRIEIRAAHEGLTTRIMPQPHPGFACAVVASGQELEVVWKGTALPGFSSQVRRVNPQLGWIEWCDTAVNPTEPASKVFLGTPIEGVRAAAIHAPRLTFLPLATSARGPLANMFGYDNDDISARFFLRDLECKHVPSEGVWRRYDLGRVRLGRPSFTLDLPAGAVVEIALSESLAQGRVQPWITLSAGTSCNLDHYVAKGGQQTFMPVAAKGGRFVEIHVLSPDQAPIFLEEKFLERHYHGEAEGAFSCGDKLLDRIWQTGVATHQACAEDTMIDNPTRERGQWAGDVGTVGLEIAAVAYSDLRLLRRGLIQCAQCAREDGLVAGLCPGGDAYLSTYAAQWVGSCVRYWELSGDKELLKELFEAAEKNMAAFLRTMTDEGLSDGLGWAFIDWGYVRNEGPSDMGLNMHFLAALRDMVRWSLAIGRTDRAMVYQAEANRCKQVCSDWLSKALAEKDPWPVIGMQRGVLALRAGLLGLRDGKACVEFIKHHYLKCFPSNPRGRRLSNPSVAGGDLITPYFSHFALAELWELGEGDFVLDQYRKCWGWALEDGRTTWVEVFDTRFSHCHGWSGCPTWQLSRYVLGLRPRFDLGELTYDFLPRKNSLRKGAGHFPFPGQEGGVDVSFERVTDGVRWRVSSSQPIHLRTHNGDLHVTKPVEFLLEE